jgi:hypothetical protein
MSTRAIIEFPDSIFVTGRRGRSFYALEAAPADDFGYEGDGAVDVLTGTVYVRADGVWSETGENFFAGALAAAEAAAEKAGEASASAGTATDAAATATTKAGEALADRELAQTAATTATTKAGEASDSAGAAAGSASTATTKAGEASDDRVLAQAAATTATTKAGAAADDRVLAQAAASAAAADRAFILAAMCLAADIQDAAGIAAATYAITDSHAGAKTYTTLIARRRIGTGEAVFRIAVNGVPVTSAITVGDTLVSQTGLYIAVIDGQEVSVVVESAAATFKYLAIEIRG